VPSERVAELPRCRRCKQGLFAGKPIDLSQDTFEQHITRSNITILVDFWATWCGPCKMMAPILTQVTPELEPYIQVVKVDTEKDQGRATRYNIRSIPILALFRGGRELARQAGVIEQRAFKQWVNNYTTV